jgi:hypothetical protein
MQELNVNHVAMDDVAVSTIEKVNAIIVVHEHVPPEDVPHVLTLLGLPPVAPKGTYRHV